MMGLGGSFTDAFDGTDYDVDVREFRHADSVRERRGEESLMIAILDQAIKDVHRRGELGAEVQAWLRGEPTENDWPMSFARICEQLDLSLEKLRDKILAGERPNLRLVIGRKRPKVLSEHDVDEQRAARGAR